MELKMVVRNDMSVAFNVSPRIVTISKDGAEPESITIQDLHDTLRTIEAYPWNMDELRLIDSYGKQSLGGGLLVGITSVLRNTKLAFEARTGPGYVGCIVTGGNLVAIDANGNSMNPIQPTAYVQVTIAQASSAVRIQDVAEWTQAEKDSHISATTNIPTNVWAEALSGITTVGSMGKKLIDVLKLKRVKP